MRNARIVLSRTPRSSFSLYVLVAKLSACAIMMAGISDSAIADGHHTKVMGPDACGECHNREIESWKLSRHYRAFREMPRKPEARQIADALGIRRIKKDKLCQSCHFTTTENRGRTKAVASISCESCHGPGEDWIKTHSSFSGKGSKEAESKAEAEERWKLAVAAGMIRRDAFYKLAKNCYSCHVVPNEKLVNVGGHPPGSDFELVSWSQGEVRHNLWYSKGKSNTAASEKQKRMLFLIGMAVEIETGLRAIAVATVAKSYAIYMAHRVNRARNMMAKVAAAMPNVPLLAEIVRHSHSAGLKLNNKKSLSEAADAVAKVTQQMVAKYDGSQFAALDRFIPKANTYVGKASTGQ